MKNVAIILQDLRSGGSERFASRLSLLLSEKFNVYVLVFDASEKRFDCAGEFVDLGLPAGKGTVKRAIIMLKRAATIKKFVKENDICTAYSFPGNISSHFFCISRALKRILHPCRSANE